MRKNFRDRSEIGTSISAPWMGRYDLRDYSLFILTVNCGFVESQWQGVDWNAIEFLLLPLELIPVWECQGRLRMTVFSLQRCGPATQDTFSVRVDTACLTIWGVMESVTVWMPLMKLFVVSSSTPVALLIWIVQIWQLDLTCSSATTS